MEERLLGRSGLKIPVLGWGTVKIGRNEQVKYPADFELPSDAEVDELVAVALDLGIRLFDTAPAYGSSEERLGRALSGRRDEVVLVTKVGEEFVDGRSQHAFDAASITRSVERSLGRLRTDHLDLLLLHSDGRDVEILKESDALSTLAGLKERGLTRAIGMSAKTSDGIRAASRDLDAIMAPFSRSDPRLQEALGEAHRAGCGVLAIKVFGQGHTLAEESSVAEQLAWVLEQPCVSGAVAGSRRAQHLRQWVEALPDGSAQPGADSAS